MRLTLSELIVPLSGAAAALAAGLLLGGFMQPHLDDGGRPAGPQMFADWAGARSTGPFDPGTTFVNYPGKMPDYVMGADWKKRMAWPDEPAAAPAPREVAREQAPPPPPEPVVTRTVYEEPPTPAQAEAYPSLVGGAAANAQDHGASDDTAPVISG